MSDAAKQKATAATAGENLSRTPSRGRSHAARDLSMPDDPLASMFGQAAPPRRVTEPSAAPVAASSVNDARTIPLIGATGPKLPDESLQQPPVARASVAAPERSLAPPLAESPPPVLASRAEPARSHLLSTPASSTHGQVTTVDVISGSAEEGEGGSPLLSRSSANRIGTMQEPYLRKRDNVRTRQASATLPAELLKRLDHCAVDFGRKRNELLLAAVEEYLERRGYTNE